MDKETKIECIVIAQATYYLEMAVKQLVLLERYRKSLKLVDNVGRIENLIGDLQELEMELAENS